MENMRYLSLRRHRQRGTGVEGLIERAKGISMKDLGLKEGEGYEDSQEKYGYEKNDERDCRGNNTDFESEEKSCYLKIKSGHFKF